jgi:hypothetical protein
MRSISVSAFCSFRAELLALVDDLRRVAVRSAAGGQLGGVDERRVG